MADPPRIAALLDTTFHRRRHAEQMKDPEYADAYEFARERIEQVETHMKSKKRGFLESLDEIVTGPIYISDSATDFDRERQTNMWGIRLNGELAAALTVEELATVVEHILESREAQLVTQRKEAHFYLWFDSQVPELRLNLISSVHSALPFRAQICTTDSPLPIIEAFLASPHHDGILISDQTMGAGDERSADEALPLPVYEVRLPRAADKVPSD